MEIKRNEKTAVNTVELEIAVAGEEFEKAVQAAYRKNVGRINVPGFRRGKAPRKIIEQLYGKAVFYEDAVNAATPEAYEAAVKEAALEPVAQPQLVAEHALFTWLITHLSRDITCTDHVALMH